MAAMMDLFQTVTRCRRLVAAAMVLAATTSAAVAQHVVVIVNGDPITALDIDQRIKFTQLTTQKAPGRQEVLNELIDEKLKVKEGKRWGIELTDAEVDAAYANMGERQHRTAEQLTQDLLKSGVNPGTLKSRLRAEMIWQQLVRGRYSASLQLSDKDVELALQGKEGEDKEAATDYIVRPILFLVPPNSPATAYESRRKDAEALRGRFKSCEEGIPAARALQGVVVRDQVVRNSGDLQPELRKILDAIPVGQLSAPENTKIGVELFAICGKQQSKADTPGKRQAREAAYSKRFEEQSKQYLRRLRREALIERK